MRAILLTGNAAQPGVQLLTVGATAVLAGSPTAGIIVALKAVVLLRATLADEIAGVDLSQHGEEA